jgi:hypothetical protein
MSDKGRYKPYLDDEYYEYPEDDPNLNEFDGKWSEVEPTDQEIQEAALREFEDVLQTDPTQAEVNAAKSRAFAKMYGTTPGTASLSNAVNRVGVAENGWRIGKLIKQRKTSQDNDKFPNPKPLQPPSQHMLQQVTDTTIAKGGTTTTTTSNSSNFAFESQKGFPEPLSEHIEREKEKEGTLNSDPYYQDQKDKNQIGPKMFPSGVSGSSHNSGTDDMPDPGQPSQQTIAPPAWPKRQVFYQTGTQYRMNPYGIPWKTKARAKKRKYKNKFY